LEGEGPKELTLALLRQLEESALEERSLKGLRKLVLAFKAASHVADETSSKGIGGLAGAAQQLPYTIASSAVFDQLLATCLTELPGAFGHHLFQDPDFSAADPQPFAKLGSNPSFRRIKPLVYRSLKALHFLLGQVTEPSLLAFLLARLERFLPFLIPFPKQVRKNAHHTTYACLFPSFFPLP
jgi:nucleolar complex protein 2